MEETNNRHLLFVSHGLRTCGDKLLNCDTWFVWKKAGGSTYRYNRHSFATLLRSGVLGKIRGVQHIWAIIGNAPLRGDCPATRCMRYWAGQHRRSTYGEVFQIYHVSTAWKKTDMRHGFDSKLRDAVFALLEKNRGVQLIGARLSTVMTQSSATRCLPRYAVHARVGCSTQEVHL